MAKDPVKTPCVGICAIDENTGWCYGCKRTLDEIGRWLGYSEAERSALLAELKTRQP